MKEIEESHQEKLPDNKPESGNGGLFDFQQFLNYDDPESLMDDEREQEDLIFIAVFGFFTLTQREEWSHIDECRMLDDGGSLYFGTGVAEGCVPSYEGLRPVFSRTMFPGGWPVEIYSVSSKLLSDVDDWMEDKPRFLITVTPTKAFVTEPIQAWAYFNT